MYIFREGERGREREGERSQAGSVLPGSVLPEPDVELDPTNREVVT